MIVVSDTSPITNLAAIGKLELLEKLYTHVLIPTAVYNEMVGVESLVPGAVEVQTLPRNGLLLILKPLLDQLIDEADFRVSHELYTTILQAAGE